ncbi:hypothetical protein K2173_018285 [Erythroxylum novogranatense]|uniref:Bifunctional inhibitor/plant lipid transfer protein/seed storage helical domain-containing protein n=1 Tax=Erythroxylum novogranatense TaxID=1862640 RepID=A0AAV8UCW1_9ROSI|nr:hypothetical protein K2173_018285 [Erythroxylum novogranatense]
MESKVFQCGLFLVVAMMFCSGATAQSGCTTVLVNLSPCLNYVTGNSSTPSSSCCSQLAKVVQSQPQCLCTLVNGGGSTMGININQTLALGLPVACEVQTPPVSRCNGVNSPSKSPASSPISPPADETPEDTPSGIPAVLKSYCGKLKEMGLKTVPTAGSTSEGGITRMQLYFTVFLVLVASSASIKFSF